MSTRRKILGGIASAFGLGASGAWALDSDSIARNRNQLLRFFLTNNDNSRMEITTAPSIEDQVCILTQEHTEGPYYSTSPVRSDVTEGKSGLPLELTMQIVSTDGCTPVRGVTVEIWHCDAEGKYSGQPAHTRDPYETIQYLEWDFNATRKPPVNSDLRLRGAQQVDNNGIARFRTIFPGWYDMRAPHIHVKVVGPSGELFTSQFYFSDATANGIYTTHADYVPFGPSPYNPENDLAVNGGQGARGLILDVEGADSGSASASAKVGIALNQV